MNECKECGQEKVEDKEKYEVLGTVVRIADSYNAISSSYTGVSAKDCMMKFLNRFMGTWDGAVSVNFTVIKRP